MSLSWVGPTILASAVAYVFHLNHPRSAKGAAEGGGAAPKALVSTTSFAAMLFVVYVFGAIPRTRFFPAWWYKGNLFNAIYKYIYCSETVGYSVLKRFMHQPQPYPHSDFRGGIHTLMEVRRLETGEGTPSPAVPTGLSENLQRWRPPCLEEAAASQPLEDGNAASTAASGKPAPHSAAAVAAAALEKLKKSSQDTAMADDQVVPPLFARRGGLPVDVQKLRYRKSDRHTLVLPVPIFSDNYSYLIFSFRTKKCCLVDPADPIAAIRCMLFLKKHLCGDERGEPEMKITDILTTHKHWDHAGGNKDLYDYSKGEENREKAERNENVVAHDLNIYGPAAESAHFVNKPVSSGDTFTVCDGAVRVDVLAAPGHTRGSLLFVVSDARASSGSSAMDTTSVVVKNKLAVFTGDALFSCGLGAPFETTSMEQIKQTRSAFVDAELMKRHPVTGEAVAPEDVLLYVGHEYTERLLEEMYNIANRMADANTTPGDEDDEASSAGAKAYLKNLAIALRDVRIMRAQTDGLDDARKSGDDDLVDANAGNLTQEERQRKRALRNRIPLCTVPTTLALEKRINPLLTIRPEKLDAVPLLDGELDPKEMERAIYFSRDRLL